MTGEPLQRELKAALERERLLQAELQAARQARDEALQQLRRSLERQANAEKAAAFGFWERDLATGRLTCSEGLHHLFGRAPGEWEFTTDDLLSTIHPDDRERMRAIVGGRAFGSGDFDLEYRIVRPDGSVRWINGRGRVVLEGGRPTSIIGIDVDVTERHLAARRVEQLHAVVSALSESLTPEQVVQVILEQGAPAIGAQAGLVALLTEDEQEVELVATRGYPEELVRAWQRFSLDTDLPLTEAIRTGEPVWLEATDPAVQRYPLFRTLLQYIEHPTGAALPLVVSGRPVGGLVMSFEERALSADERAFAMTLAQQCGQALERARLFDAERRARQNAEAAEARYRGLFHGTADAILLEDERGQIIDANPAAESLLGYDATELRQRRAHDLIAQGSEWAAATEQQLRAQGSWRGDVDLIRKDGSLVPVEAFVTQISLPDGVVQLGVLRDISRRREVERLQQEFLAMVTHELRNPLTPIRAHIGLMEHLGSLSPRSCEIIVQQTRRLERLINDLLDSAQLDVGRLELFREAVDLVSLSQRLVEEAQAQTERHHLRLEGPAVPVIGWWDRSRLEQVLSNLLSNAIKYSPEGGEVVVTIESQAEDARVSVRDQGMGIAAEAIPRIFDRFGRGTEGRARGIRGLGLGLHITRSLVEAHGGTITVASEPGEGSIFTVSLPRHTTSP